MPLIPVYTPECAECGVPTSNTLRRPDGVSLCRECCPPEEWRYQVVYADPPWPERGGGKSKRGADRHYALMTVDSIARLGLHLPSGEPGVLDLAAPDSFLFLWATNNHLADALHVLGVWGFRYVTNFAWVKDKAGLGFYGRGKHELLLLGVRGKPPRSEQPSPEKRADYYIPHSAGPRAPDASLAEAGRVRGDRRVVRLPATGDVRPRAAAGLGRLGRRGGRVPHRKGADLMRNLFRRRFPHIEAEEAMRLFEAANEAELVEERKRSEYVRGAPGVKTSDIFRARAAAIEARAAYDKARKALNAAGYARLRVLLRRYEIDQLDEARRKALAAKRTA